MSEREGLEKLHQYVGLGQNILITTEEQMASAVLTLTSIWIESSEKQYN